MENRDMADRCHLVERVENIDEGTWETIVKSMPIPSVDLVVKCPEGVLLGNRANEPAKGDWFIPGGRIQKGEPLNEAVHRIAEEELDLSVAIKKSLGTVDHFYEASDVLDDCGKHYVAHGFLVESNDCSVTLDDQHSSIRVFQTRPDDLHQYVETFLNKLNQDGIFGK